jgi:hypothetical protein
LSVGLLVHSIRRLTWSEIQLICIYRKPHVSDRIRYIIELSENKVVENAVFQ